MLTLTYTLADQNPATTKSLGILNLSLQLLKHLAAHPAVGALTVFGNSVLAPRLRLPARAALELHDEAAGGGARRALWDQWGLYAHAGRQPHEWLFLPKGFASFVRGSPCKLAAVVADGMSDYYARHYPRGQSRLEHLYFTASFKATLRQAQVLFAISDFTAAEIQRLADQYRIPCPPVVTMGVGFEKPDTGTRPSPDAPEILVLTSRFPHKRTDLALEYVARFQAATRYPGAIHCVGSLPPGLAWPDRPGWHRHARLDEQAYRALMARCGVLVYVSEYEGFGMPAVEAALAGLAPVYSDIPALREVMLGTGCPFANASYDALAAALERAVGTPPAQVAAWADRLLAAHHWPAVTARVVKALEMRSGATTPARAPQT